MGEQSMVQATWELLYAYPVLQLVQEVLLLHSAQLDRHCQQVLGLGKVSMQKKLVSTVQVAEHPSLGLVLPSSHPSEDTRIPSPHWASQVLVALLM
jgi:hypothetical protein